MKQIPLTQGKFAIVDEEDFERISRFRWYFNQGYAGRQTPKVNGRQSQIRMHREILEAPKGVEVDHKNGDKLDNRKSNLRLATRSQQCANIVKPKTNKSGFKGVSWHMRAKKWVAQISFNKKKIHLGYFDSPEEAHRSYLDQALKYFGEFACNGRREDV